MPRVGAADEHRRCRAERLADVAARDQLARRLVRAAEERVRRTADPQLQPRCLGEERAPSSTDVVSGFSV